MSNEASNKSSVYQYQQIDIIKGIKETEDEIRDIKELSFQYYDNKENELAEISFVGKKSTDLWKCALKFIHRLKYIKR